MTHAVLRVNIVSQWPEVQRSRAKRLDKGQAVPVLWHLGPAPTVYDGRRVQRRPSWPVAVPAPLSLPFECTFFGIAPEGEKIAFAIDHTGSVTDTFVYVKTELKGTIRRLGADREFDIIFWSSGPPVEQPGGMVRATAENKEAALEFIESIIPVGQCDPVGGIRAAFAASPDTIYLLTDGEFDRKVITLVDKLNKDRRVAVNTILIGYQDADAEAVLERIAEDNDGIYRFVSKEDLMKRGQ